MCFQNPIPIVFKFITFVFWDVGCLCELVVSVNSSLPIWLSCSLSLFFFVVVFLSIMFCLCCGGSVLVVLFSFCTCKPALVGGHCLLPSSALWGIFGVYLTAWWDALTLRPNTQLQYLQWGAGGATKWMESSQKTIFILWWLDMKKKKDSVHLSVNLTSASKYSFKPTQRKQYFIKLAVFFIVYENLAILVISLPPFHHNRINV